MLLLCANGWIANGFIEYASNILFPFLFYFFLVQAPNSTARPIAYHSCVLAKKKGDFD